MKGFPVTVKKRSSRQRQLTSRLGIEHHCISFTSLFGDSLDAFLTGRETQACSICGILRKKALVVGAHQAWGNKACHRS